jgi:hypothetical protein
VAIETSQSYEQTKLVKESHEERLTRLFELEMKIINLRDRRQQQVDMANALKNEIKVLEKDKVELVNLINSGQGTFITIAASTQVEEMESLDDIPSDDELAEFDDLAEEDDTDEECSDATEEASDLPPEEGSTPQEEIFSEAADEIASELEEAYSDHNTTLAKPDHRVLINADTMERLGRDKTKTEPNVGAIHSIPPAIRFSPGVTGKSHYLVKAVSLVEGEEESYWETFVELLSQADWEARKAVNPSGIPF